MSAKGSIPLKTSFAALRLSKRHWCARYFWEAGDNLDLGGFNQRPSTQSKTASTAEVRDQLTFARILLRRYFRLFQHNRPTPTSVAYLNGTEGPVRTGTSL
jgi:hypothetical protein